MDAIDYKVVSERIPPGTIVRGAQSLKEYQSNFFLDNSASIRACAGIEGFLIRYGLDSGTDASIVLFFVDPWFNGPMEWNFDPPSLDYLINGQWLTFEQVMA